MDEAFKKAVLEALAKLAPVEEDPEEKERKYQKEKADKALEARIKSIETSTAAARSNWFWFFGVLAFVFVTIIGLNDGALFLESSTATLPVIGFSVNLRSFLFFAPALITVVYIYLHGLIEGLWENLSSLPDRFETPDGKRVPIIEKLPIWLLIEFALLRRDHFRNKSANDSAVNHTSTGVISSWAMAALIWPATPAILIWLWWRTLVMHDLWLSLWQVVLIVTCICFGWMSRQQMNRKMREEPENDV